MNLMNLKLNFFTKFNLLKIIFSKLHQKTQETSYVSERPAAPKRQVINPLINQFSQQNKYLFQERNTDKQLETNLEIAKSEEKKKLETKTTENNSKTEDTRHWKKRK